MIDSLADTLVCDTVQIAAWQSDPAYAYNRELIAPEASLFGWLGEWVREILQKIFGNSSVSEYSNLILIGIAVLILVLLLWFIYKNRPKLFMRSRKNALPYAVTEDTIYGIDFEGGIAASISRRNYKEAVRLLYLQTLKRLSDRQRVDWQPYKTPTQYLYEVRMPAFRQLTDHFLRIRYGNFEATATLFHAMRTLQEEIEKGGEA